jgi:hypothetical protein
MRTQIFVEGFELDLTDDIACEISYVIDDVKDFGSKNTSYSKTIVIQGSQKNNKIFNHISELGRFLAIENVNTQAPNVNENYTAAVGSNCIILVDNIQIFKGKLRVMEVVKYANHVEYECAVFGELGGFYYELSKAVTDGDSNTSVGSSLLEHINFTDLDHFWNWTNINNSWNNRLSTPGVGYFYPLINYGKVDGTALHDFHDQALRPAIYVKEYIDRIFALSKYTYDSSFFNSDFFKRLVIPNNSDTLKAFVNILLNNTATSGVVNNPSVGSSVAFAFTSNLRNFTTFGTNEFKYTGASTVAGANFNLSLQFTLQLQDANAEFWLYKNGAQHIYLGGRSSYAGYITTENITWNFNLNDTISTNDVYSIRVVKTTGTYLYVTVKNFSWTIQTPVKQLATAIFNTDKLNMSVVVPQNIKITDFFTSLLKMFNLYVIEDRFVAKKLIITPYIDFYLNESLDWSDKLNRNQEIRLKPMGELNARVFNFKFKQDDAYWNKLYKDKFNEGYMDFTYDTEYEYAKDKDDLEVIFSSTVNYAPNGEEKIIPYLASYDPINGTQDIKSTNIRILQTDVLNVSSHWKLTDSAGGTIQNSITRYPYSGMWEHPTVPANGTYFQSIGWASPKEIYYNITGTTVNYGLFNAYWSQYFAEITNPNSTILTAQFHLTSMDIRTLDFAKNILIDGTMWRINKVDGYDPLSEKPTKVELLKVIDTIY